MTEKQQEPANLTAVLVQIQEAAGEGETRVEDIVKLFDGRSYGALITFLALLEFIPIISGLPGFSAIVGGLLIMISLNRLFSGGSTIWLPERFRSMSIASAKVVNGTEKLKSVTERVDNFLGKRLIFFARGPIPDLVIPICVTGLALLFFPFSLIPFGVLLPAAGIIALGLAVIGRDGILALVGYLVAAASAGSVLYLFL